MLSKASLSGGMNILFPDYQPQGIQQIINNLPVENGLTLIEAPTGSGKTEAALAYASHILSAEFVDSIVFAMPTQATANAMLGRIEQIGNKLFPDAVNVVLAHGKARFNSDFIELKKAGIGKTVQGAEEAFAQCAQWLSSSRKRVFLGQIGVCTIDQVLLSVLPIRHHFVRAFGIRKSILIIDEIHAYDSYMNGLLDLVLKAQQKAGGSAILLSATLPAHRRNAIFKTWGISIPDLDIDSNAPYPLLTHARSEINTWESPEPATKRTVEVTAIQLPEMLPTDEILQSINQAALAGAQVVVICNLVAVAQKIARQLKHDGTVPVDLFHSRFRFVDRQKIENEVLARYGKGAPRDHGRILVATQVVEQSLDLDFDLMFTQLCPVDLLFQRLGRLHRHSIKRPVGYEQPRCVVFTADGDGYGLHAYVYGDKRILWRTEEKLKEESLVCFPEAYRKWIESVYSEKIWPGEPDEIIKAHEEYLKKQEALRVTALTIGRADTQLFSDTDGNVAALTRDGEMSLNVVPMLDGNKKQFLNGLGFNELSEWELDEALNMNTIPAPHSWKRSLPEGQEGLIYLTMSSNKNGGWSSLGGKFTYDIDFGLIKEEA